MRIQKKSIVYGIIIVPIVWILSGFIIYLNFGVEERGSIGDMFGAVNALFSGFALFGIVLSIIMQQEELGLQRTELNLTREEFKINRLTNILYKQIDLINKIIENSSFDNFRAGYVNMDKVEFEKFLLILEKYNKENQEDKFNNIIEANFQNITILIRQVTDLYKSYEEIIIGSNIPEEQCDELRTLLHSNLLSPWYTLNEYFLKYVKKISSESNDELDKFQIKNLVENLEYINSYTT